MSLFLFRFSRQGLRQIRVTTICSILLMGLSLTAGGVVTGIPSASASQASHVNAVISEEDTRSKLPLKFLEASEALYNAVNNGSWNDALDRLSETERLFRILPMDNIESTEGIQALAKNITDLKRTAAAISPKVEEWQVGAATLRLSADALAHPDHPIWHQYQAVMQSDIAALDQQVKKQGDQLGHELTMTNARIHLNQLTRHYLLIRTSVLMQSETWKVERSDSVIRYVGRVLGSDTSSYSNLSNITDQLTEAINGLFPPGEAAKITFVPPVAGPSWAGSAMMGSFIVLILTGVGWMKYKAEPYVISGKSSNRKNADELLKKWIK